MPGNLEALIFPLVGPKSWPAPRFKWSLSERARRKEQERERRTPRRRGAPIPATEQAHVWTAAASDSATCPLPTSLGGKMCHLCCSTKALAWIMCRSAPAEGALSDRRWRFGGGASRAKAVSPSVALGLWMADALACHRTPHFCLFIVWVRMGRWEMPGLEWEKCASLFRRVQHVWTCG